MMRLLLVDEHEPVHAGLARLLKDHPSLELCAHARCALEALQMLRRHRIDLVLVDLMLQESTRDLNLTGAIRAAHPGLHTMLLLPRMRLALAERELGKGEQRYFADELAATELLRRLEAIEQEWASNRTGAAAVHPMVRGTIQPRLSSREREVCEMFAAGGTVDSIARVLGRSRRTVQTHKTAMLSKLGFRSIEALRAFAAQQKLSTLLDRA